MSDTLYWPDDYLDEWMPEGRASPDAWLERTAAGDYVIAAPADCDGLGPISIKPGDTITFCWHVEYGAIPILVRADGSFELEGEPHPEADQFSCPPAAETTAESLEEFARGFAEKYLAPQNLAEERVMVDMGTWCEALYRLTRTGDTARFELVTAHAGGSA